MRRPGVWPADRPREVPDQPLDDARTQRDAEVPAPQQQPMSNFLKLKEEVVKHPTRYIQRWIPVICRSLGADHEAVRSLSAFGDQARRFAAEILAIIEWGTQHWQLQESFPVPVVPKWLRTLEFVQTTMPVWGELPLAPPGTQYEDIRV